MSEHLVKSEDAPEHLKRMYEEYDEVCDMINSEFFAKFENRISRCMKFINDNIDNHGDSKENAVPLNGIQKTYLITQYHNMAAAASSFRAYEQMLSLRIQQEEYLARHNKEEKENG